MQNVLIEQGKAQDLVEKTLAEVQFLSCNKALKSKPKTSKKDFVVHYNF